jgi:hypothetical protein
MRNLMQYGTQSDVFRMPYSLQAGCRMVCRRGQSHVRTGGYPRAGGKSVHQMSRMYSCGRRASRGGLVHSLAHSMEGLRLVRKPVQMLLAYLWMRVVIVCLCH